MVYRRWIFVPKSDLVPCDDRSSTTYRVALFAHGLSISNVKRSKLYSIIFTRIMKSFFRPLFYLARIYDSYSYELEQLVMDQNEVVRAKDFLSVNLVHESRGSNDDAHLLVRSSLFKCHTHSVSF